MSTELRPLAVLLTVSALIGCASPTDREFARPQEPGRPETPGPQSDPLADAERRRLYYEILKIEGWLEDRFRSRADEDLVFVHAWDSGDLYELRLSDPTEALFPIAGITADPQRLDRLVIPELNRPNRLVWSAKHSVYGDVYVLISDWGPTIVLMDSDGDSSLDGHLVLSDDDWVDKGFADTDMYDDLSPPDRGKTLLVEQPAQPSCLRRRAAPER